MPSQIKMLENIQPSEMEKPSQLLLKWSICSTLVETFSDSSQMEYMFYISRYLLRFFSIFISSSQLKCLFKWSTCSTSVLMISYEIDHVLLEYH